MNKVLVTGGCGFIGKQLCPRLLEMGNHVVILDKNPCDISGVDVVEGNIQNIALVGKLLEDVTTVYHLAAVTTFHECQDKPDNAFEVNVYGTRTLLQQAVNSNVKRFVFFSAAAIYAGNRGDIKYEDVKPSPISIYGETKRSGELLCQYYHAKYGLSYVNLRLFNVYGHNGRGVINKFIEASKNHKPIIIYGDGTQVRDFIYVNDVVRFAIEMGDNILTGEYNVGTGIGYNILQVKTLVEKASGMLLEVIYEPRNNWDIQIAIANMDRAGYLMPDKISLEQGVNMTINS